MSGPQWDMHQQGEGHTNLGTPGCYRQASLQQKHDDDSLDAMNRQLMAGFLNANDC